MSKDFWKGVVAGFILSLIAAYSFFRIYWITEVGLKYLRWHAVLWLYLSVAVVFAAVSYYLYKRGKLKTESAQKKYLIVLSLFAGIYLAEFLLRVTHNGTTYTEQREGVFVNPAERMQKSWYMTGPANQTMTLATSEYSYPRTTNSLGLSDEEWSTQKDSDEIRIITLGDSFTEGDGCASDSSYAKVLEGLLQKEFPQARINVMNAGHCGSDPWFEYKKLSDLLLKYKPDIVTYTNSSNDLLFDHLYYGGMERFAPDSTVKNKISHYKWLGLYEASYVFRIVMNVAGYDNTLMGAYDREQNKTTAIEDAKLLSKEYSSMAVKNGFSCIQIIRPEKFEIKDGSYQFDITSLLKGTEALHSFSSCNLLSFYKDSLRINEANVNEYFWKVDEHHNAKGYSAMAKGVFSCVKPLVAEKLSEKGN